MAHRILIFLLTLNCFLGCKKDPGTSQYPSDPVDVFDAVPFSCLNFESNNYFTGKIGKKDYCIYDCDATPFRPYMAQTITSTEPTLQVGSTPSAKNLYLKFKYWWHDPMPQEHSFYFVYYSTQIADPTTYDFLKRIFKVGEEMQLSTFFMSMLNYEQWETEGAAIQLDICMNDKGNRFVYGSDFMVQPRGCFIRSVKFERIGDEYEVELDVNVLVPVNRHLGDYKYQTRKVSGKFHAKFKLE
jgi:hypothetical protein